MNKKISKKTSELSAVSIALILMLTCISGCSNKTAVEPNAREQQDQLVKPFWKQDTMYNESVCMIRREDGSITAPMLFTPTEIISVKDNYLQKEYVEGVDYTWESGTNQLKRLEGSSIPYFTENDVMGWNEEGTAQFISDELGRSHMGNALFCTTKFLYEKQIAVTYKYEANSWSGSVTEFQGDRLPNTMEKLQKGGETIKTVFYGDSIFTGCDSSGMYDRAPYQPTLSNVIKTALEEYYNVTIDMTNTAAGGMTSQWGAENAVNYCANKNPDLVIMSFGMNDGWTHPDTVRANMQTIVDETLKVNPDCEFIIVSSMVPNASSNILNNHPHFAEAFSKMPDAKENEGVGMAFANMYAMHEKILETKDFISTSGNNINHPNDWLARVYAMNILSCMVEFQTY